MRIFLARHGKDNERVRGGWSQEALVPEGVRQARWLAEHLRARQPKYGISHIITSDLPRTLQTAQIVQEAIGVPLDTSQAFREINNGVLAGMDNERALREYPGLFFRTLAMDEAYPGGESPRAFYRRIEDAFYALADSLRGGDNVLLVTHRGVIDIIYYIAKGMEWTNRSESSPVAYASLHMLEKRDGRWQLVIRNEHRGNPARR